MTKFAKLSGVFALAALVAAGCTQAPRTSTVEPDVEQGAEDLTRDDRVDQRPGVNDDGGSTRIGIGGPEAASLPVAFYEKTLVENFDLKADELSYRFQYLATDLSGKLEFENGKAEVTFEDLESGKTGDLKLSILEANEVVLAGEIKGLKLSTGSNRHSLTLKRVGDTGDLTIDIGIDDDDNTGDDDDDNTGDDDDDNTGDDDDDNTGDDDDDNTGDDDDDNGDDDTTGGDAAERFAANIQPIMDQHCVECHHSGQTIDLSTYPMKSDYHTTQAEIMEAIIDATGAGASMPPGPRTKLNSSERQALSDWLE